MDYLYPALHSWAQLGFMLQLIIVYRYMQFLFIYSLGKDIAMLIGAIPIREGVESDMGDRSFLQVKELLMRYQRLSVKRFRIFLRSAANVVQTDTIK
eukprot:426407-Amphidinium_carterae.1